MNRDKLSNELYHKIQNIRKKYDEKLKKELNPLLKKYNQLWEHKGLILYQLDIKERGKYLSNQQIELYKKIIEACKDKKDLKELLEDFRKKMGNSELYNTWRTFETLGIFSLSGDNSDCYNLIKNLEGIKGEDANFYWYEEQI